MIPAYNSAMFLEETLASVFLQTRLPDELIVVDDASTDDTAAIARNLGATVIVLPQNSSGPAVPLNTALASTQCDWIATLDHDDHWHPDWLENAERAIGQSDACLVFGRVRMIPENPAAQKRLDDRCNEIKAIAEPGGAGCFRIASQIAYNELVPSLNYAVTCSNIVFSAKCLTPKTMFDPSVTYCCDYRLMQEVSETKNIAFIDSYSCDWVNRPTSHYQRGMIDKLDRDLLHVYARFDRRKLTVINKAILAAKCQKTALDLAYEARLRGEYVRAFRDYVYSLIYGGFNRAAMAGLAKLPIAPFLKPRVTASRGAD